MQVRFEATGSALHAAQLRCHHLLPGLLPAPHLRLFAALAQDHSDCYRKTQSKSLVDAVSWELPPYSNSLKIRVLLRAECVYESIFYRLFNCC